MTTETVSTDGRLSTRRPVTHRLGVSGSQARFVQSTPGESYLPRAPPGTPTTPRRKQRQELPTSAHSDADTTDNKDKKRREAGDDVYVNDAMVWYAPEPVFEVPEVFEIATVEAYRGPGNATDYAVVTTTVKPYADVPKATRKPRRQAPPSFSSNNARTVGRLNNRRPQLQSLSVTTNRPSGTSGGGTSVRRSGATSTVPDTSEESAEEADARRRRALRLRLQSAIASVSSSMLGHSSSASVGSLGSLGSPTGTASSPKARSGGGGVAAQPPSPAGNGPRSLRMSVRSRDPQLSVVPSKSAKLASAAEQLLRQHRSARHSALLAAAESDNMESETDATQPTTTATTTTTTTAASEDSSWSTPPSTTSRAPTTSFAASVAASTESRPSPTTTTTTAAAVAVAVAGNTASTNSAVSDKLRRNRSSRGGTRVVGGSTLTSSGLKFTASGVPPSSAERSRAPPSTLAVPPGQGPPTIAGGSGGGGSGGSSSITPRYGRWNSSTRILRRQGLQPASLTAPASSDLHCDQSLPAEDVPAPTDPKAKLPRRRLKSIYTPTQARLYQPPLPGDITPFSTGESLLFLSESEVAVADELLALTARGSKARYELLVQLLSHYNGLYHVTRAAAAARAEATRELAAHANAVKSETEVLLGLVAVPQDFDDLAEEQSALTAKRAETLGELTERESKLSELAEYEAKLSKEVDLLTLKLRYERNLFDIERNKLVERMEEHEEVVVDTNLAASELSFKEVELSSLLTEKFALDARQRELEAETAEVESELNTMNSLVAQHKQRLRQLDSERKARQAARAKAEQEAFNASGGSTALERAVGNLRGRNRQRRRSVAVTPGGRSVGPTFPPVAPLNTHVERSSQGSGSKKSAGSPKSMRSGGRSSRHSSASSRKTVGSARGSKASS